MNNQTSIVITTIFPPTPAVRAFAQRAEGRLIVVGDRKTPAAWALPGAEFIPFDAQNEVDEPLSRALPANHYARKNIGYLHAIRAGARIIVDTDDDNAPKENWHFPAFSGRFPETAGNLGFINVYGLYTGQRIWPRGLPLTCIDQVPVVATDPAPKNTQIGIWQGLADDDPDVDAIYRLVYGQRCFFQDRGPIVLPSGTYSPFNSQNTAFREAVFPLLYLPATVSFRFTDILRGLVAQPILHAHGYTLGFLGPTVVQDRNPHDLMADFASEVPVYLYAERVMEIVRQSLLPLENQPIGDQLRAAYHALVQSGIVHANELPILEAWLAALHKISP